MSEDRHARFLGIPAGLRPPKAHVLLGVEPDVNDPEIIEAAVQRRMDELDKYALSNDRATREQVQKLMNEVAKARVKLVQRAEQRAKKATAVAAPEPTPVPVVPTQTPTPEQPPIAAVEHVPVPRKASLNFKFKFHWPRLSAEAWSLLGVAWLMSLAVTAVGAYFVASSQSPVVELASQTPSQQAIAANTPTLPEERDPATEPEPSDTTAQAPPVEPDETTQPTQPTDPPIDPILTWEQVEQIQDPDARLQAFIQLRDSKDDFGVKAVLVRKALNLFNGISDVNVSTYDAGNNQMQLIVKVANAGDRDDPNFGITDISPLTGFEAHGLTLGDLSNIRDFEPLRTARLNHLNVMGCTGLTDYSLFKSIDGLQTLILDRTKINDLNKLAVQRLDWLSLQNCPNLTSLDGLQGKSIKTLIANQNPALKNIDALARVRGLKELNLSHTGVHRLDALAAHQLTQLDLGSCYNLASITPLEQISTLERLVLPPVGSRILKSDLYQLQGRVPGLTITHSADRHKEPDEIVYTHIADHNKLDKFKDPADRHAAFIKLRESYEPFSEEQIDLIWRELLYINNTNHVMFKMQPHATEPKIMVGVVDNLAGNQNNAITDLSPLAGISTHTLSVQRLPNLRDFDFLKGLNIHTLDLTGCKHFDDLSILQEMKGLSSLSIGQTAINDLRPLRIKSLKALSVDGSKGLRDLNGLQGMQLGALSVAGCTSLRDISALSRVRGLTHLDLEQTPIKSVSSLAGQRELKSLSLKSCVDLSTLTGLHKLVGLEIIFMQDTPSLDHIDLERLEKSLSKTKIVYIDDDVVAQRNDPPAPPKTGDQFPPLTFEEIRKIQDDDARMVEFFKLRDSMEPYSNAQADLLREAIRVFNNARGLDIKFQAEDGKAFTLVNDSDGNPRNSAAKVTDLSVLKGLTFETLDLTGFRSFKDFGVLETMTIKELNLSHCVSFTEFSSINKIDGLQSLDVSNTSIESLGTFDIDKLKMLNVSGCSKLISLNGIENKHIIFLRASGIPALTDYGAVEDVQDLQWLDLSKTGITHTYDLQGCVKLTQLDLSGCADLSSLSGVYALTELKKLDLSNCPKVSDTVVRYMESRLRDADIKW